MAGEVKRKEERGKRKEAVRAVRALVLSFLGPRRKEKREKRKEERGKRKEERGKGAEVKGEEISNVCNE